MFILTSPTLYPTVKLFLEVSPPYEPTLYAAEDVMYTLFELEEHYPIQLHDVADNSKSKALGKHIEVDFHSHLLDSFLQEWLQRKKDLADGIISKAKYMEWKVNWPQTTDDCGKTEPSKKWRK